MFLKLKNFLTKYAYIYLPILTLLCLAGFIGSYLFPNKVLDTYSVNTKEQEGDTEYVQYFTGVQDEIGYCMETDGRPMKGIQIGISKQGAQLDGCNLIYRVYAVDDADFCKDYLDSSTLALLDEERYPLGECMDGQYPYLPFGNDLCKGKIFVTFSFEANDTTEAYPGMYMNHSEIKDAYTYLQGEKLSNASNNESNNIKVFYIYTHDTYPFLYDARVMMCVFLAASACICYPKKKKEDLQDEK